MAFRKCQRSCKIESGWRLATVEEVRKNLEAIKHDNLVEEYERVRLLDGWMGGSSDDLHPKVGFRSCLGYMLLLQYPTPDISGSDDMVMHRYSDVNLDEEGMKAAFFLCCEDWNYEVVYWLLNRWAKEKKQKLVLTGNAGSLTEMMLKRSEEVSKVAMALHTTRPMKRVRKADFTRSSMESMVSGFLDSFHEKTEDTESLDDLYWDIQAANIGGQCWREMGLTPDLERFQEFGFNIKEDWQQIANIVWYIVADALAAFTVQYFVSQKHNEIDQQRSTSQKMDDQAFVISTLTCASQLLRKTFIGTDSLWRVVKKAAIKAQGNYESLKKIICAKGYGTFSYDGKYGFLNSVLVAAAKTGDADFVERLLEFCVEPLETDDVREKTALHHAANLPDEDNALRIATALLNWGKGKSENLADARDHKQRIPLHRAAYWGHKEVCELLLEHHSDICAKDMNGQNPLHYALCEPENDEVIAVLMSGYRDKLSKTTEKGTRRVSLLDEKDENGKTPLDLAVECQHDNIRMVARLLLESDKPEAYFQKLDTASYLQEFCLNGYGTLVEKLLESGADPLQRDSEGKTALHYAAEGQNEDRALELCKCMLLDKQDRLKNLELARASDKYGRNVLHVAAFVGHKSICEWLLSLENQGLNADTEDRDDQSALYYAVAGNHDNDLVLDALIFRGTSKQGLTNVDTQDSSGTTPLHIAAERGNHKMVAKLVSRRLISQPQERQSYVRTADVLGQTALHKAASGGHIQVVRKLLEEGAHPLEERDCDGKTALHHAVQAENENEALRIVKLILSKCDEKEKSLLLFASAVGIGYAEQSLESNSKVKIFILKEKEKIRKKSENLVRLAAESGNIDMTRELLTRGARISDIHSKEWFGKLHESVKQKVDEVKKQIVNMVERGTDKPTLSDNLGRSVFADGLAALFLNPFVESPITVGISGEWGMGKSSLMLQTESILLKTAAQLAFTDLLQTDDFPGSKKRKSSNKCEVKNEKLRQSIERMLAANGDVQIWDFLSNYQSKDHAIFKSLAVMDHGDTFGDEEKEEPMEKDFQSDRKMQFKIPSILTVRYNAWNYRSESEAWAGLAVVITKELESTMTVAQRLRTSWRYTWANRRRSICVDVILPCCFAIFLAIWTTVILWLVFDRVKGKNVRDLKYGSLPLSLIAVVWAVLKSVMSVVKPISSHMLDYMSLPDHSQKLGYHHKVANDINFLKDDVGRKPFWLWNVLAFIWCCVTFSLNDNYILHTTIPKTTPASKDNLRMIVFVDDLDRCQESVVLQILSAVNLVLVACEIDVVLGMDKSMIERAIIRSFGDKSHKPNKSSLDMAEKYLRKIIQLPLELPDPSDPESLSFLKEQLGVLAKRKKALESAAGTQTQNVNARRKQNPKFRMGTLTPKDFKIDGVDISDSRRGTGLNHRLLEENDGSLVSRIDEGQQEEARGESADTLQITIRSGEQRSTDVPISNTGSDISCVVLLRKLKSWFVPKKPETPVSDKTPLSDEEHSKLSPITSELLLPKYSKGERDAFYFLQQQATCSRKLPREWKRFLNYHRLAWNILFKSKEVKAVAGWQVQLISWVFVCWQWKDRIDTLIQEWDELNVLRNWIKIDDGEGEGGQNSGPSLREIVEHYMEDRCRRSSYDFSVKAAAKEELVTQGTAKEIEEETREEHEENEKFVEGKGDVYGEEWEKAKKYLQQQRQMKSRKEKGKREANKEMEEEVAEWKRLKETLRKYNVSMDGIQAFQKFRFNCVPGHLHWPLQESSRL